MDFGEWPFQLSHRETILVKTGSLDATKHLEVGSRTAGVCRKKGELLRHLEKIVSYTLSLKSSLTLEF